MEKSTRRARSGVIVIAASARSQSAGRPLTRCREERLVDEADPRHAEPLGERAGEVDLEPLREHDGSPADGAHLQARHGHRDADDELAGVFVGGGGRGSGGERKREREQRGAQRLSSRAPEDGDRRAVRGVVVEPLRVVRAAPGRSRARRLGGTSGDSWKATPPTK